jgi:hypothetical protein
MNEADDTGEPMLTLVTEGAIPASKVQSPAAQLEAVLDAQLRNVVDAVESDLEVYQSLRNVTEAISGEYGDRVIFELVQNAHDAHEAGDEGAILLKLVVSGPESGDLYVANRGNGFNWKNVSAIRNVGVSSKPVGDGIGNKGLGFRSVEILTDDPHIYSQTKATPATRFNGFCFRFAQRDEICRKTAQIASMATAERVAQVLPRYLAAVPLRTQSDEIVQFAKDGFATVVHLPLRTQSAVDVARSQIAALTDLEVPLLLFLDRLASVAVEIHDGGSIKRRTLSRKVLARPTPKDGSDIRYETVSIAPGNRTYLIARRPVDRERLMEAVEASIPNEPQLARWRDWRGTPSIGVAVPISENFSETGRIYNFLPMAAEVPSRIKGHLDAPFYASIDRRRANFDLALNAFLLDELAETSLRAATELQTNPGDIGRHAIFDLAAWSPDDVQRLNRAAQRIGIDWLDCPVVPAAERPESWTTFRAAYVWHDQGYRLLSVRRLVKSGVEGLADPRLGQERLTRLVKLLEAVDVHAIPKGHEIADWVEAVALYLDSERAPLTRWAKLYDEARKALSAPGALKLLGGKSILKTRDGSLHSAMTPDSAVPVFIREASGSPRGLDRAPLPPTAIASKFAILDDGIGLAPEVAADFLKAGLVRRYDPLQALRSIQSSFGDKPAPKRREAALKWAFDVWRSEGASSEQILRTCGLYVETRGGWMPATSARFSDGWTSSGQKLATYLAESSSVSPDCAHAAEYLLASEPAWVSKSETGRRQWVEFLRVAGVRDGLPLLKDESAPQKGSPQYVWEPFRQTIAEELGRSATWVVVNSRRALLNPYTDYTRKGELWRIPGQVEHAALPLEAKQRLAELLLAHLSDKDQSWLRWHIGRYERWGDEKNETEFLTPAATFIAHERWMPIEGSADRFARPSDLWSSTDRKQRPPRFVERPRERLAELIDDEKLLAAAMFAEPIRLRDWSSSTEAVRRLASLAGGATGLEPRERVTFRKVYQQAWSDVCASDLSLSATFPVAVASATGPTVIVGNPKQKPRVFVTGDALQTEARAVLAAGQPVLELGDDEHAEAAIEKLMASGGFEALAINPQQVGVLLDGELMVASASAPLLATDGLDWLPEAAVLANEVLGQGLERQISSTSVEQRLRRVRVRHCDTIELSVGGTAVDEPLRFYALPDDQHPTLVIAGDSDITWSTLADAAPALSTLLDRRMQSFERLLLRLAARRSSETPRQRPSDEDFARVLGCKVELVQEHTLALRADGSLLLTRLLPVVACVTDFETAEQLREQLGESPLRSDVVAALSPIEARLPRSPSQLLDELARPDFAEVRRVLELDYGRLNQMLSAMGLPVLSNEGELRRLFETWKGELAEAAKDRLRRRFWPEYTEGQSLETYVSLRDLAFVEFQESWVLDREQLTIEDVRALVVEKLDALLGPDVSRNLTPLSLVRSQSNRLLQRFIDAHSRVMGAWCHRNNLPNPWADGALTVLKKIDQLGLIDFEAVTTGQEIPTLLRANQWPASMPHTTELAALGLDPDDLDGESRREREHKEKIETEKRTIQFSGMPLDTRASDFAARLTELASARMADGEWLTRSRRKFSLAEQARSAPRGAGQGGKGGKRPRPERLNDDVKAAMGFASEYLARSFLMEKHKARFDDRSWVSENRRRLEIDWDGDDSLGFDFRVRTTEAEWRYEVKSSLEDSFEFEFTQNEMRVAAECAADTTKRYRILYVPFVFDPTRWRVMELPNPMSPKGRSLFKEIGSGATRLKFGIA